MPNFAYVARNRAGQEQTGQAQALSANDLAATLRTQGLLVISIAEDKQRGYGHWLTRLNPFEYRPFNSKDVEESFRQLAIMLRSGLDLVSALEIVAEYSRISVRKVWLKVIIRIRAGGNLTDTLGEHKVFNNLIVQMVRMGEQTGNLDKAMLYAAVELEEIRRIRGQLISALTYPLITLLFAIGVTIFMLIGIIPELKKFLQMMGRKLPPITQSLIDVSDWFTTNGPVIIGGVVIVAMVFGVFYYMPWSRLAIDRFLLHLPIIGHILRLSGTVAFARALGALLRSGVRIVDALETVAKLQYNRYLSSCVETARSRVIAGSTLAEPLAMARHAYMPLLHRMVVVGENSGTLDDVLNEVTIYHQEILQRKIRFMSDMIAPVITVLVGGIVGFVYAAFIVAMFSAGSGVSK
jgi:type IV pilus assembly protein PilC